MSNQGTQTSVRFNYIKADEYRSIYADGVWGGVGPEGYIDMAFFSDRAPIPKYIDQELQPNGSLGGEIDRQVLPGRVRDVHVNVKVDLNTAISLRAWLDDKIEQAGKRALNNG